MNKKSFSILFIIILIFSKEVFLQEIKKEKKEIEYFEYLSFESYVIDSKTFIEFPSSRSLIKFHNNIYNFEVLFNRNVEKMIKVYEHKKEREIFLLEGIVFGIIYIESIKYIIFPGIFVVHEYAHRTRDVFYGYEGDFNPEYLPFGDNPYSLLIGVIKNNLRAGKNTWENSKYKRVSKSDFLTRKEAYFLSLSGGINQQVNLADAFVKRLSFMDSSYPGISSISYVSNKLSYFYYNLHFGEDKEGDIYRMIDNWRERGYIFSRKRLANVQLITYFLSEGSYIFKKEHSYRIKKIKFPDFYTYYNLDGPSLKIATDYQVKKDFYIIMEYEYIYDYGSGEKKNRGKELTVGFAKSINEDKLTIINYFTQNLESNQSNIDIEVTFKLTNSSKLGVGLSRYHLDTLSGERNIPNISKKRGYNELFVDLYVLF